VCKKDGERDEEKDRRKREKFSQWRYRREKKNTKHYTAASGRSLHVAICACQNDRERERKIEIKKEETFPVQTETRHSSTVREISLYCVYMCARV
jgi:hypothetical protein